MNRKSHFSMTLLFSASAIHLLLSAGYTGAEPEGNANAVKANAVNLEIQRVPHDSPDFFPILPWDPQHGWKTPFSLRHPQGIDSMAECNFTIAGFVRPEDLPLCDRLGIAAIVLPDSGLVMGKEWRTLSGSEIDSRIRGIVERSNQSPSVMGYFITDEPGAGDFEALGKAVAAVKKYAPGKLAYINLFPDYATLGAKDKSQLEAESYTEYLERYISVVKPQFLSYDNYMVQYSDDMRNPITAASYYRNLLEVRRVSLEHGIPFWNIVSSNQIRPNTTIPSPANLLFQACTTLAAGGRGVSWYTYYGGGYAYAPVDRDELRTPTWRRLREVNRLVAVLGPRMNRLTSTGVYFTAPSPASGLPELPGKLIRSVFSPEPVMVGEFTGEGGSEWVMLVNLSLERSAKCIVNATVPLSGATVVSPEDGSSRNVDPAAGIWLTAGEGILMRVH